MGRSRKQSGATFIETRYRLMPYLYTACRGDLAHGPSGDTTTVSWSFPTRTKDGRPDRPGLRRASSCLDPILLIAAPQYYDLVDKYSPTLPGEGWYQLLDRSEKVPEAFLRMATKLQQQSQASPDGTTLHSAGHERQR